mgnify:CR=1 FL=1
MNQRLALRLPEVTTTTSSSANAMGTSKHGQQVPTGMSPKEENPIGTCTYLLLGGQFSVGVTTQY